MEKVKEIDKGWNKLKKELAKLAQKEILVGIQAGTFTSDGGELVKIAAAHEFGTVIDVKARNQTVYRKINKNGEFARSGRFVNFKKANFSSIHKVAAHSIVIPERSFLRATLSEKSSVIKDFGKLKIREIISGTITAETALQEMGNKVEGLVKKKIRDGPFAPNAQSTIRKKKSSKPLIDTGTMRNSVRYVIKNKGGKK